MTNCDTISKGSEVSQMGPKYLTKGSGLNPYRISLVTLGKIVLNINLSAHLCGGVIVEKTPGAAVRDSTFLKMAIEKRRS
jgi:hypothetical protein